MRLTCQKGGPAAGPATALPPTLRRCASFITGTLCSQFHSNFSVLTAQKNGGGFRDDVGARARFLTVQGLADAESALRQLDAEPEPQPTTDNFSVLESMLIRRAAAAAQAEEPVLKPLSLPNGVSNHTDQEDSVHTNQLLSEKMQAMERAARAAPMQWHDPRTDPEVDEWTDDEALGYQQIEVSEELLMRGFRAAEARAEAAASAWERQQPRVLDTSKMGPGSGRDPIFEAFENPSRGAKGDVVETDKGAMADDESEEEDDECDDADEEDDGGGRPT